MHLFEVFQQEWEHWVFVVGAGLFLGLAGFETSDELGRYLGNEGIGYVMNVLHQLGLLLGVLLPDLAQLDPLLEATGILILKLQTEPINKLEKPILHDPHIELARIGIIVEKLHIRPPILPMAEYR